ncbi:MAG: hypothetical protein R3E10_00070 [Gemmatimonadota bacterium]
MGFRPADASTPGRGLLRPLCSGLLFGALILCGLPGASGQALPPDSAELHSRARNAQSRFERLRVRRLPREMVGSGGCDEVIGRICMSHDGDDDRDPPPEEPEITEARDAFLRELSGIAARIPRDDWVVGQRVWYALEAGRADEALRVARDCAGEPWWCAALRGLAAHGAERFEVAERAFDEALATMPAERREEWSEAIEPVLGRERLRWLEDQPDRAQALERFWLLADPSWLIPGNDRRSAHYARLTAARIRERAKNPYGLSWGFDLEELLVRYGWEVSWGRDVWRAGRMGEERVVGHHPPKSREYAPPVAVLERPLETGPDDWALERERPHTAYAPVYARGIEPMVAQFAAFRREDGVLLVAAPDSVDLPGDRGLVAVGLDSRRWVGGPRSGAVFSERLPWGDWMLSAEWIDRESGRARRTRYGARFEPVPADVAALSDLLLVDGGDRLPATLGDAIRRAHAGRIVHSGERLALAWELYRLGGGGQEVGYRVLLEPLERGLFRRAGEWAGLLDPERPVVLAWSEVDDPSPEPRFRAVDLVLPDLEEGAYRLTLEVSFPGRSVLTAAQELRVLGEAALAHAPGT